MTMLSTRPGKQRSLLLLVTIFCLTTTLLGYSTGVALAVTPPDATNIDTSTDEDTSITIDTGVAVSSGYVVALGTTPPAHGTATAGNNSVNLTVTYVPGADLTSTVTFKYQFCIPSPLQCGTQGTIKVTINAINDPPVANPDTATVTEDSLATDAPNTIAVLANDNAGPNEGTSGLVLVQVATQPAHGVATKSGNNARYAPNANFCNWNGISWVGDPEIFTYDMRDSSMVVVTAQVTVKVTCVNDNPVAVADTVQTTEDADPFNIAVLGNDSDPDGDTPLTVSAVSDPAHGTTSTDGTVVTYQPDENYCNSGGTPDTFTYTVVDGHGGSANATVSVDVVCVIDPPVLSIVGPNAVANHSFSIDVMLTSIDVDIAGVQFSLDYDESCLINPAKVPGSVPTSFDPPFVNDNGSQLDFLFADTTSPFDLLAGPSAASVQQVIVSISFEIDSGCLGASDEVLLDFAFHNPQFFDENVQTVSGLAEDVTDMPVTANESPTEIVLTPATIDEGIAGASAGSLSTLDADLPNDSHAYSLVSGTGSTDNNLFEISGDILKLLNNVTADFESKSSYSVRVQSVDSYGASTEKAFVIDVLDLNERPIAVDDGTPNPVLVMGSTQIAVLANDSDPDGGPVTVQSVTNGAHGTASSGGTNVTFVPTSGYSGLDSFTYTIIDSDSPPLTDDAVVHVVIVADVARGDCDASGSVNIGDIMAIAREIFDNSGQPWYLAFNRTYAGSPYGCDANGDQLINLVDITCAANIIFGHACGAPTVAAASLTPGHLAVGAELQAEPGAKVRVPILLDTGGNSAVAASFAINFSATDVAFDTTDEDGDGVYDAVELNVASDVFKYVYYNEEANRLEFILADISDPFLTLADGEIAAVTLTVNEAASTDNIAITLSHSEMSDASSQLIPVEVTDGAIVVGNPEGTGNTLQLFIPIVAN